MSVSAPLKIEDERMETRIPGYLSDLSAVAIAVIGRDGLLREGNRAFFDLMPDNLPKKAGVDVRGVFVNPRFDQFSGRRVPKDGPEQVIYEGILNLGHRNDRAVSLHGAIHADAENLFVVAEHNVTVMEQLNSSLRTLNEESAEMQRELARLKRRLSHQEDVTEAALQDRHILLDALTVSDSKEDA